MKLAVAAAVLALGGSGITVTTLPRPGFKAPAGAVSSGKLVLVSLRYVRPEPRRVVIECAIQAPFDFRGTGMQNIVCAGDKRFALYGRDGASARYLLAPGRHAFDFKNYVWPPRIRPGEREFVYEQVIWAREADGVLYVENAHSTYARSSYGRNAYITAIDLKTKKKLWRSAALVANADTFVLAGKYLVTGYGFTAEPDYLYLLDRRTGRALGRLKLPSAPERITRRGNTIRVRTYDHDVVVRLRGA
jgi:hypothetical protein